MSGRYKLIFNPRKLKPPLIALSVVLGAVFAFSAFASSPDAIAIRVIPNPKHYSPLRWYNEQGFSGSPQMLAVDGYEAIRDGRTVYVNAANISGGSLYTNIYLISYNQDAETATIDIFGRILDHWKFNTNIAGTGSCGQDDDGAGCLTDDDCSSGAYCDSDKAEIIRDTKRLAELVEINLAIESYKDLYGYYPTLEAGTYLPNITISTWPSWQDELANKLGTALPVDPINALGDCPDYDETTCWNEEAKEFADSDPEDPDINPPDGSNVFIYASQDNGVGYSLCSVMESGYIQEASQGACSGSASLAYGGSAENSQPRFTGSALTGYSGDEFNGYIAAADDDNDQLSWSINTEGENWGTWSAPPTIEQSGAAGQKRIYAAAAGEEGSYMIAITVNDGRGENNSEYTQTFTINITNDPPVISANDTVYAASSTNPMDFRFSVQDSVSNYPLVHSVTPSVEDAISGFGESFTLIGDIYYYAIGNSPDTANVFNSIDGENDYVFTINVTDGYNASSAAGFTVTIINNPPQITIPDGCSDDTRINNPYTCQITAFDPEGNDFSYSPLSGAPLGLSIDGDTGEISGSPAESGTFTIVAEATDEYGYLAQESYILTVNTYCGDGDIQSPNMEGVDEVCEDGNTNDDDACDSACQWTCESTVISAFNIGENNALVYDDNNNTDSAENVDGGPYLKLATAMPTPYIWVANSQFDGCIPGTNCSMVSKLRTYAGCWDTDFDAVPDTCYKRTATGWDMSVIETPGQLIGRYDVGDNPSRTAVNVETGDVWIANRDSDDVTKLDIDGNHLKTCSTGAAGVTPRGVAIEENGDVWVANSEDNTVVKISGDDMDCSILQTVNVGDYPYGLAVDSNNNIWISTRGDRLLQKIDTADFSLTTITLPDAVPVDSTNCGSAGRQPYGIAVDLDDNVWVADTCDGVWKYDPDINSTQATLYTFAGLSNSNGHSRGVTINKYGNIWIAMDESNQVIEIPDPGNPNAYTIYNTGGEFPVGICGDSAGYIWAINQNSDNASVFDGLGALTAGSPFPVSSAEIKPYTYSDMTGLNRALILRSGDWNSGVDGNIDGGFTDQHWGDVSWQEIIPSAKQSIEVYVRASNDFDFTADPAWISADAWNNNYDFTDDERMGRYLQIKAVLRSNEQGVTPVLWDLSIDCL